ncbi:MAG: SIMPL domain-containing protein [Alphaproteobacteria bacterium]|nr:SIMPL domain-containing protein [Alphaproteobacteria bacterium]
MKKTFIWVASVIGAGAVMSLAFDAMKMPTDVRTISVSGECLTSAPKDRIAITLRVTTLDKSAVASMKHATDKMAQITDFLKKQDVKMQTTEFNSYEKTEWNRQLQKSENVGFETRIAVEVSADDMNKIETILNNFAGQPNVYTENLRMFTSSETLKPIMEKCLSTALENARVRANALAAGDNRKAGKLLSVSYGDVSNVERPYANYRLMAAKSMDSAQSIDTGGSLVSKDTEITVHVSAVFEIR